MTKQTRFLNSCGHLWRRLLQNDQGSHTLEAVSVFPLLMAVTLTWLISALILFQGGVVQSAAARAAEAAVFLWDNSKRGVSGLPPAGEDDGLYWRLAEDSLLHGLLSSVQTSNEDSASALVSLPVRGKEAGSLAESKLSKSAHRLSPQLRGQLTYHRETLSRRAEAALKLPFSLPGSDGNLAQVKASAAVIDPVEFIRSVDLVRYYTAKFQASREINAASAGKALTDYASGRP